MTLQIVRAKLFAQKHSETDLVSVFHGFIQRNALPDILIDVADYEHVHHGPGVVLLAHAAHYALDDSDGELGVLHARRRDTEGTRTERFERVLSRTLLAAEAIERETQGAIKTDRTRVRFEIADKLSAPNTDATFEDVRADLESAIERAFSKKPVSLTRRGDARGPLSVDVAF